jgi:hypothetical protein
VRQQPSVPPAQGPEPAQRYVELHGELESALPGGLKTHPAVDREIARLGAYTTADNAHGSRFNKLSRFLRFFNAPFAVSLPE